MPRWLPGVLGVAVYSVLGVLVYGAGGTVSSTSLPAGAGGDLAQSVWFTAWEGYAVLHGRNPLFSSVINYPHGYNLFDATSSPLLGILASPLTAALGPVASFNLLMRLAFVLSACAMFFVLRRWTSWWPAAFVGGLLYGFSPYMIGQGYGHIFAAFVPLPPLLLLALDEIFRRRRWPPALAGGLFGLLAALQLLISLEVLAGGLLLAACGLVLLAVWQRSALRAALRYLGVALLAAGGVFLVLAAYPLWFYFRGPDRIVGLQHPAGLFAAFYNDVAGLVLPTVNELFGPHHWKVLGTSYTGGNIVEISGYLGIPLIVVLLVLIVRFRRVGVVALSALVGAGALVLTFGTRLHVGGTERLPWLRLPYAAVLRLPVLKALLDVRLALFVYLAAAVILAVGLDRLRSDGLLPRRDGVPAPQDPPDPPESPSARPVTTEGRSWVRSSACLAVAVVALLPLLPARSYTRTPIPVPAFFRTASLLDQVPAGAVVLPYPNAERTADPAPEVRSMLWQAVARMRFRMIGVYGPQPGPDGRIATLADAQLPPVQMPELLAWCYYGAPYASAPPPPGAAELSALRSYLVRYRVQDVLAQPVGAHPATFVRYLTLALGAPPRQEGGIDGWFEVANPHPRGGIRPAP
jgi:hypothetical protein